MSIVVNGSECFNLNLASAYVEYLKSKSMDLASHYETQYEARVEELQQKATLSLTGLEKKHKDDLELCEQKLSAVNRTQVLELVDHLDSKLSMVVGKVLSKLGVYNISAGQIAELIRVELSDLLKSRTVSVRANADTINYLKFCVDISNFVDAYEEDNDVKDGSCIISDGMCVFSADVASVVTKIKEIFKEIS